LAEVDDIRPAARAANERPANEVPGKQRPVDERPARAKKALIHAFVLFHLTAVVVWSLSGSPLRAPLEKKLHPRFARYMQPLGLWQSWIMFAPNPAMANAYLEAEVTFRDGSRATWPFPRMEKLGYVERFRRERYRKWANERIIFMFGKADPVLGEAAAKFAVRQLGGGAGKPLQTVELVQYRADIPAPHNRRIEPYEREPAGWERHTVLTYHFDEAGAVTRVEQPATAPSAGVRPTTSPADHTAAPQSADQPPDLSAGGQK
jgi:hypothetical protein